MHYVDSHCHLDDPRFKPTLGAVIARARQAGVGPIVVPGVAAATWERTRQCCEANPGLYAAYGLHPYFLGQHKKPDLENLDAWLGRERPVAVGECGLDYFLKDLDPEQQQEYFSAQIDIACNHRLPLIIHARKAMDAVIARLRKSPTARGVIHSFAGSEQQAMQLVEMGFCLGIGASVQFDRAQKLKRVVANVPVEALLIETDAPDQPGPGHRGGLNEPAHVTEVAAEIARLRVMPREDIAHITADNARSLFQLPETLDV